MKNEIKRFTSLIVCLCMISCMITVFAAEPAETANNDIPTNVSGLFNALGIIKPEDNVSDGVISRGQFAIYAARLVGDGFSGESGRYYIDVPEGSFCYDAVSTLVKLDALSVGEDKNFNPNNEITYDEACKIVMCILGFKDYSEAKGGYPSGYRIMARQKKLDSGLRGTDMNLGNSLQMLYNSCKVELLDAESITDTHVKWTQGIETILSLSRKIFYIKGRVDKNDVVSLIDDDKANNGAIRVKGELVNNGETDIEKKLGHYVEIFYQKNSDDELGSVIFYNDLTETTVIDIDDYLGYSNGVLEYYNQKSGTKKNISVGAKIPVLLNGVPVKSDITGAFNGTKSGSICLNFYEGKLNIVEINRKETLVVKYKIDYYNFAWDAYRDGVFFNFDADKMDRLKIYAARSGGEVGCDHIFAGQVLSIYRSLDGKVADVYVSEATVSGFVNEIKDDKIKIDGVEYKINEEVKDYVKVTPGTRECFYLDKDGEICVVEPIIVPEKNFVYIYDIAKGDSPFVEGIKLKVFTLNSEHKILNIDVPVLVDGQKKETEDQLRTALANTGDMGTYRQVVGIKTNSSGVVTEIDTAAETEDLAEKEGTLVKQVKYTGDPTDYYNSSGYPSFFPAPIMYRGTKVIIVPEEAYTTPSQSNFKITDKSYFNRTDKYKISSYKYDSTQRFADIIVVRKDIVNNIKESEFPVMIDEVYETINDEGEVSKAIKGIQSGQHFEAVCRDEIEFSSITRTENEVPKHTETHIKSIDDLRRGDLVRVVTDIDGKICMMQVIYDFEEHKQPYWFGKGPYNNRPGELRKPNATMAFTYGFVVDKLIDKNRKWDKSSDIPGIVLDIGYTDPLTVDRSMVVTSDYVTIYDVERDFVYNGRNGDIITSNSGCGRTEIIVCSQYAESKGLYAYVYPKGR